MTEKEFNNNYKKYRPQIYNYVKGRIPLDDINDIIQEISIAYYSYNKPIENHKALLYKITRNKIADYYRKNESETIPLIIDEEGYTNIPFEKEAKDDKTIVNIEVVRIKQEIEKTLGRKEAKLWKYHKDPDLKLSIEEASILTKEVMQMPEPVVRSADPQFININLQNQLPISKKENNNTRIILSRANKKLKEIFKKLI